MANNTDIVNLPSEELALLLNQQYQELMRAQNNIGTINKVLESRKTPVIPAVEAGDSETEEKGEQR